jgi:phosphohistidine swiveling domain-containing protein
LTLKSSNSSNRSDFILPLDTPEATLAMVGGKGINLTRLARAGFSVPGGFLITTDAYRSFVAANQLESFVLTTAGSVMADDPTALEAASTAIRERFAAGRVPPDLETTLRGAYADLDAPAVAVRSSATAEDLPEMSFAGQQDTLLNVVGAEALLEAVVSCWSSLWTARAIGYRARNEIPPQDVALAVVVQVMAKARASGVLFTANPLNGRRTEIAIDAGLGLGEALVSGQLEPDHYVVAADGQILEKTLGSKALSIRPRPEGGIVTVDEDAAEQQALPDGAITSLARLGRQVAELYGTPQDIEWAWDGEQHQLLQTRPITSLFPVPEGLGPEPLRLLFSFGAVQGMLDPITPLGRDVLRGIFAGAAAEFGLRYTVETLPVLQTAAERLFIDLTELARHPLGRRLLRAALPMIEPGGAGALEPLWDDPRLSTAGWGLGLRGPLRAIPLGLRILVRLIPTLFRPEQSRERMQRQLEAFIDEAQARAGAAATLEECISWIEQVLGRVFPLVATQIGPRLQLGIGSLILLNRLCGQLPGEHEALEMTRGLPHNVTTEMDLVLWQTARSTRSDPQAKALFDAADAEALAASYLDGTLPRAAQLAVAEFMQRYGMRGVGEIDLGRPRWREDPTPIMQALSSYLQIEDAEQAPDAVFARGAAAAEAAIDRLVEAVRARSGGRLRSRVVRWAARRMRALAGLRETPKFTIMRLAGIARAGLLASGGELSAAGVLARPDDVFFLRMAELRALAAGEMRDWQTLIEERRQLRRRELRRAQIPRFLLSDGQAIFEGLGADVDGTSGLIGSPVSPGVVEGVVHVLLDPHATRLAPGEILVCPATDPGWTPLFLAAGGLVMEVGGLMTHGAVVAREYGIPAVVGVHEATTRLRTGQRIRVDGSSGRIELLDDEGHEEAGSEPHAEVPAEP